MYGLMRPLLFRLDPERAHRAVIGGMARMGALGRGMAGVMGSSPDPRLRVDVAGLSWPGPVGLAAGLDKNGEIPRVWERFGFGAMELGTVTAEAQAGNPRPRVFRFPEQEAIINRLGFNNEGAQAMADRLEGLRDTGWTPRIPVGINIGKTRTVPVEGAVEDYRQSARIVSPVADYLVVNVSSPNTPGLRGLQAPQHLREVLGVVQEVSGDTPVFVKLAPDLGREGLEGAVRVAEEVRLAGLIATNTTLERHGLPDVGAGGISGRPLQPRALEVVRLLVSMTDLPVIGVGGISCGEDALAMLRAGARAVQVYTALIFQGPALVDRLNRAVLDAVVASGSETLAEWQKAHR